MPYLNFESDDDYVSLWYNTNVSFNNVGSFDPDRPTLLLFHPTLLDTQWLTHHFADPRLSGSYNMIAFDMRVAGRSSCRPTGRSDFWVQAADIGRAHHMLHLPPVHVMGIETLGCNIALRFAALFPDICLSLIFCNPPPPIELKEAFQAYDEALHSWCFAEDLDSFEKYGVDAVAAMLGPENDPDLEEELVSYWALAMPPTRRVRVLQQINLLLNRKPCNAATLNSIALPVLVIHGEHNHLSPKQYAHELGAALKNAQGGALVYIIKGAGSSLSIVGKSASLANLTISKFLSRQPRHRSDLVPPELSLEEHMQAGLQRLAGLMSDGGIADRNPLSSLSFCCLDAETIKSQTDALVQFRKGQLRAMNPVHADGRLIRRYTRNRDEHWFQAGVDGLSHAQVPLSRRQKQIAEDSNPRTSRSTNFPAELVSAQQVEESRVRRVGGFAQTTVDRQVIKGSVAKVMAPSASALTRMLL